MISNYKKVLLICAPSSSGKSLISSLLNNLDPNFVKLNTKVLAEKTRIEISQKYFAAELAAASEYFEQPIHTVMQLFQMAYNTQSVVIKAICDGIRRKESFLGDAYCYEYLYKNYFSGAQEIIQKPANCIIDHNIFLDPFPERKNTFLKYFSYFKDNLKILNLFNPIENTLLNVLGRNKRFFAFALTHKSGQKVENEICAQDTQKGYSFLTFRQPLRLLEDWASMYDISTIKSLYTPMIQQIKGEDFQSIINIAHYEQEKLIGVLCFKNYPASYIHSDELITLKKKYAYLSQIGKGSIVYISEKRFNYDYRVAVDHDIINNLFNKKYKQILDIVSLWPTGEQTYDLRTLKESDRVRDLIREIEIKINQQRGFLLSYTDFVNIQDRNLQLPDIHIIQSFLNSKKIIEVFNHIITNILLIRYSQKKVFYPISQRHYTCATIRLSYENNMIIEMYSSSKKKIYQHDNNLIFLGKLYTHIKNYNDTSGSNIVIAPVNYYPYRKNNKTYPHKK
jgi:hypothetical protein